MDEAPDWPSWYSVEDPAVEIMLWIDVRSPDRCDEIDRMLTELDVNRLPVVSLLSVLNSTLPLKTMLTSRVKLLNRISARLNQELGEERTAHLLRFRS